MSKNVRIILDAIGVGLIALAAWALCVQVPDERSAPKPVTPKEKANENFGMYVDDLTFSGPPPNDESKALVCTVPTHISIKQAFYITDRANDALEALSDFASHPSLMTRNKVERAIVDILTFREKPNEATPL
jgi:hypothetical protein